MPEEGGTCVTWSAGRRQEKTHRTMDVQAQLPERWGVI